MGTIIITILQINKLRPREGKWFGQGCTGGSSHVRPYSLPWKKGRVTVGFGLSTKRDSLFYTDQDLIYPAFLEAGGWATGWVFGKKDIDLLLVPSFLSLRIGPGCLEGERDVSDVSHSLELHIYNWAVF